MVEKDDKEFNSRTLNCKMSRLNHVILPNRVVSEYNIRPYDIVGLLGKRAHGVGLIAFEVPVHRYNHSVIIPKRVAEFCEFSPGVIRIKLIGVRHTKKLERVFESEAKKSGESAKDPKKIGKAYIRAHVSH